MAHYTANRLEGRALEHGLSKKGGYTIRMKDEGGNFVALGGPQNKKIRQAMQARADQLVEDMAAQGLHKKGAETHVKLMEGGQLVSKSVDLRLRVSQQETDGLFEVKWTRGSLSQAQVSAQKSLDWLKEACVSGRWAASGKRLQAGAVGTVVVTPKAWRCHVHALDGSWSLNFPQKRALPPKSRSGSSGPSGYSKRAGDPQKGAIEAQWRQSPKGKALALKLKQTYRAMRKKEKEALMKKPASRVVSKAAKPLKLKRKAMG